jgi:hypothetical protein
MTTLFGLLTNKGPPAIVLGADTRFTFVREDPDAADSDDEQYGCLHKIVSGPDYAIAITGNNDDFTFRFMKRMSGKPEYGSSPADVERMLRRALKRKYFAEIAAMNRKLAKTEDFDDVPAFMLAVAQPLGLYRVDEFGNLHTPDKEDIRFIAMGSSRKNLNTYVKETQVAGTLSPFALGIPEAVRTIYNGIEYAIKHDKASGGSPDIAVVTENGVRDFRSLFERYRKEADERAILEMLADCGR